MHLSQFHDDPRPQQRARVMDELNRASVRLQREQIPLHLILRQLVAFARAMHEIIEAERNEYTKGRAS